MFTSFHIVIYILYISPRDNLDNNEHCKTSTIKTSNRQTGTLRICEYLLDIQVILFQEQFLAVTIIIDCTIKI